MRLQICSISSKSSPRPGSSVGSVPHSRIVPGRSPRCHQCVGGCVWGIGAQLDLFVPNRFIPFFLDPYGLPPSPFLVRSATFADFRNPLQGSGFQGIKRPPKFAEVRLCSNPVVGYVGVYFPCVVGYKSCGGVLLECLSLTAV